MKNVALFIYFFAVLLICATCRKEKPPAPAIQYQYPEDPATTTITPQQRLAGMWKIDVYTFKDSDIVAFLDTFYGGQSKIQDVQFIYNQNLDSKEWSFNLQTNKTSQSSQTAFNPDDPVHFVMDNDNECCKYLKSKWFITPFRYIKGASTKWTITKLYDKKMNLVLQTDSGNYKIFFSKTCCK